MNRKDFKRILKPLIKECIKEVIFEEGVLSTVITEVVKGTQTTRNSQPTLQVEQKQEANFVNKQEILEEKRKAELARRRKLLDASGFGGVDIFEGTEPLRESGSPAKNNSPQGMFSDLPAGDAGVDISALMSVGSGHNWKKLARNK
tara:strand:+ start:443 stop:880 length:438 start_codon:yes stop_codon:yes gene_type:complete